MMEMRARLECIFGRVIGTYQLTGLLRSSKNQRNAHFAILLASILPGTALPPEHRGRHRYGLGSGVDDKPRRGQRYQFIIVRSKLCILEEVLLALIARVEEVALAIVHVLLSQKSVIYILGTGFGGEVEVIGMKHAVFVDLEGIGELVEVLHA
jgi:hypothetical protein